MKGRKRSTEDGAAPPRLELQPLEGKALVADRQDLGTQSWRCSIKEPQTISLALKDRRWRVVVCFSKDNFAARKYDPKSTMNIASRHR
jgi:hypothetical protein